jgi:hypothetical protein
MLSAQTDCFVALPPRNDDNHCCIMLRSRARATAQRDAKASWCDAKAGAQHVAWDPALRCTAVRCAASGDTIVVLFRFNFQTPLRCHRSPRPDDPIFRRHLGLCSEAAAYWMPRLRVGLTGECGEGMCVRILAAFLARGLRNSSPSGEPRAQKAGCRLHPWLPCNKSAGVGTTGSTGFTPALPPPQSAPLLPRYRSPSIP